MEQQKATNLAISVLCDLSKKHCSMCEWEQECSDNPLLFDPIFAVMKKDGNVRLVQDFRALNNQSYTDKYSMKDVSECIGEIGRSGSTIFSTIDLTAGFWQMILHPRARPYTAFTVPGMGQFQWVTSPMGLLGCPASFQRLMETVVNGLANVIVYIDDLLVHSATHMQT